MTSHNSISQFGPAMTIIGPLLAIAGMNLAAQPVDPGQPDFAWARVPNALTQTDQGDDSAYFRFDEVAFSLASDDRPLRSTLAQPREELEIAAQARFASGPLFGRIRASYASEFDEEGDVWLDGSYLAVNVGNWIAALDKIDRWWGPGWDGSLILSNNARPVPAVSLSRAEALPFDNKYLSWIGPWSLETFMGQLESDRIIPDTLLWGMRIELEPVDGLLIGLNRTAQWGGKGRPNDLDTFFKLLIGRDNRDGNLTIDKEPGNQLSGFDIHYDIPNSPFAVYSQWIGEDEAGMLPYKFMTQYGAEWRGQLAQSAFSFLAYAEYSDTKAGDDFNIGYAHSIYRTGYRYDGASLGHAIDSDSTLKSIGILLDDGKRLRLGAKLKSAVINRDGRGQNSVSIPRQEQTWIELWGSYSIDQYNIGIGFDAARIQESVTDETHNELGGFVSISRAL